MAKLTTVKTLYYDKYENDYGDGFYPHLIKNKERTEASIELKFQLISHHFPDNTKGLIWRQVNNLDKIPDPTIKGLDGDFGKELLRELNTVFMYNVDVTASAIANILGNIVYTDKPASSVKLWGRSAP